MISLQQKVTISSEVLAQEIDEEAVLLDMKSESYFGLYEVGTRIWQLLKETGDLQTVFDTMLEEYDVDEKQLKKDLLDHVTQLVEAGLISLSPLNSEPKKRLTQAKPACVFIPILPKI